MVIATVRTFLRYGFVMGWATGHGQHLRGSCIGFIDTFCRLIGDGWDAIQISIETVVANVLL